MRACQVGLLMAAACVASCGPLRPCFANCNDPLPPKFVPDPTSPPALVVLIPNAAWVDTGITVHKGDRLLFTATGEVSWQAPNRTTTPDGEKGLPGWRVGPGGLHSRIGVDGKPFDLGARTDLFQDMHPRAPHHPYPPPPIKASRDGVLYLGFKNFTPGGNTGMFEVTVRRAVPATASPGNAATRESKSAIDSLQH
jgi:hypothetical protein